MFSDIRQKLVGIYKVLHTVSYPSLPVNYPNRLSYDPEQGTSPFVVLNYSVVPQQMSLGLRHYKVPGDLYLFYYYRPNTGIDHSSDYSDFLMSKLGGRTIDGITFWEVRPYANSGIAGWEGTMNRVPFLAQYFNVA
jgi:hypothetical protein